MVKQIIMNPYYLKNKTVVSFSGGRSSAYMLYKIIEAHNFNLPDYIKVIFCNTGKEMPHTLQFVKDCADKWSVDIVWLEYAGKKKYKEVTYDTASRNGEPFKQLIIDKNYLPNSMARFCTSELKVLTIERYMKCDFDTAVGIRGDEPRRVVKMRAKENYLVPLADAKVTEVDVSEFWQAQDFDLQLPKAEFNTLSNCDLCFLKGTGIRKSIIEQNHRLADWWIEQEEYMNARFNKDSPKYSDLKIIATDQSNLFEFDNNTMSCFCSD